MSAALQARIKSIRGELGGLPWRDLGAWLQSLPAAQHVSLLRNYEDSMRGASQAFGDSLRAFRAALARATANEVEASSDAAGNDRLVYVTMVYGRMNRFISGWALRAKTLGIVNLVLATLDAEAYELCQTHYVPELCVRASVSVLNKYTLLLVALQLGLDVMWLDFDIFLVRHPTSAITRAVQDYELLMGYDLDSDCLCNGFFYIRARPRTHRWLFELVRWLYDHPYEHDQRAMGAFLNYTEKISADPEELPAVPSWHVFDEENIFINYGSWLGDFNQLTIVHFVDGSAFSLYGRPSWDASIPTAKTPAAAEGEQSSSASCSGPASPRELMAETETTADKEWPEKAHTAGNAGVMVVGRSALHGGLPAVLLGGRFYFKRKEYLYTDFGGGVNRKDKESPLLGAFRELAEELFGEDEETAKVTAQAISEGVRSQLLGGRPFISGDYVMFVVTADALVSSLDMDPGDSAIDRLFEHARFFDSHGKANPELSSVALISIGELLRSAASDGLLAPLQTRHSGKPEAKGAPEVIKLRPVMVGWKGSISVLHKVLEDFASSQHSGNPPSASSGYAAPGELYYGQLLPPGGSSIAGLLFEKLPFYLISFLLPDLVAGRSTTLYASRGVHEQSLDFLVPHLAFYFLRRPSD
eukprot:s3131_g2.t4